MPCQFTLTMIHQQVGQCDLVAWTAGQVLLALTPNQAPPTNPTRFLTGQQEAGTGSEQPVLDLLCEIPKDSSR